MYQKKEMKNKKGITLIALIITIIVLLILAGVSISMVVGENGILNRATDASQKTKIASEREAIELAMSEIQMDSYINDENKLKIGENLLDKKVGNSNWKVILRDDKVYGTGWIYLKKGTDISEFGILEKNWLMNLKTGEIIVLEDGEYSIISATDAMAIKDNIIFNLDSSVIDGNVPNTKDGLENSLGNGVKLKGFNFDNNSGLTETSFKFDGFDDYIEMPFDKNLYSFNGGLTLEFYGKILGKGTLRHEVDDSIYNREEKRSLGGFFEIRDKNVNKGKMGIEFSFDDFEDSIEEIVSNFGYSFSKSYSIPYIRKK